MVGRGGGDSKRTQARDEKGRAAREERHDMDDEPMNDGNGLKHDHEDEGTIVGGI